jgi:hypothetical protein
MKDILLVNDVLTKQFEFIRNGSLSKGMEFRDEFFYHLASFDRKQQQSAFDLAWVMSRGGKQRVVVTATKTQYRVWLGMRSPVCTSEPCKTGDHCLQNVKAVSQPAVSDPLQPALL